MARWGKCEYKELQALQKRLETLQKHDWDSCCNRVAQDLANILLAKVKSATPVGDTVCHSVDMTDSKGEAILYQRGKRKGQAKQRKVVDHEGGKLRRAWGIGPVTHVGGEYQVEVFNNEEYASYVEYGHRQLPGRYVPAIGKQLKKVWVDGKFMMTISEKELMAMTPKLLASRMERELRRYFDG